MRVRGNAYQVMEKYLAMARDASAAGDRIAMENYLQHAEHYYRMLNANGEGNRGRPMRPEGGNGSAGNGTANGLDTPGEDETHNGNVGPNGAHAPSVNEPSEDQDS